MIDLQRMAAGKHHPVDNKDKCLGQISHHTIEVPRRRWAREGQFTIRTEGVALEEKNPYSIRYQRRPAPCQVSCSWRLTPLEHHELAAPFPCRPLPVRSVRQTVPNTCPAARPT